MPGEREAGVDGAAEFGSPPVRVVVVAGLDDAAAISEFPDAAQVIARVKIIGSTNLLALGVKPSGYVVIRVALFANLITVPHKLFCARDRAGVLFGDFHTSPEAVIGKLGTVSIAGI